MFEILATPGWDTVSTPLARWVEAFQGQGLTVHTERESTNVSWLEIGVLRLRGYVVMEGLNAEAINFELPADENGPARQAIERAAAALGWQLDDEQDDGTDDD